MAGDAGRRRELPGFAIGPSETGSFWTVFLCTPSRVGLRAAGLVITAAPKTGRLPLSGGGGASFRRWSVRFLREE